MGQQHVTVINLTSNVSLTDPALLQFLPL